MGAPAAPRFSLAPVLRQDPRGRQQHGDHEHDQHHAVEAPGGFTNTTRIGGSVLFPRLDHRMARTRTLVAHQTLDRKSTRLNSSHVAISYAVFCLKKKTCNCTK